MLCRISIDHFGVDITLISTWASEAHTSASSEREKNEIEQAEMKTAEKNISNLDISQFRMALNRRANHTRN